MDEKSRILSYIAWYLLWLKANDANIVITKNNDVVIIEKNNTDIDSFISYFKSQLLDYILFHNYALDWSYDELYNLFQKTQDDIFRYIEQKNDKLVLDISGYKWNWF